MKPGAHQHVVSDVAVFELDCIHHRIAFVLDVTRGECALELDGTKGGRFQSFSLKSIPMPGEIT